tara:strand:- start:918 stop:1307 length:390 start_codon:yes stop_codon:yes gene_type:complete
MPLNRREFLGACTAATAVAAAMGHKANAEEEAPAPEPTAPQELGFPLDSIYEPDGELHKWGTSAFGNWRTFLESRRLYGKDGDGYGIFLPYHNVPLEIIEDRDAVRARVEALLTSGEVPINRTPSPVWE